MTTKKCKREISMCKDHLISMYFLFAALHEMPLIFEQMAHNEHKKYLQRPLWCVTVKNLGFNRRGSQELPKGE